MDIYDRQHYPYGDQGVRNTYNFTFIGCGGLGTWSAIALAMSGIARGMLFVDDDELEITNLNRLPYTADDIGKKKVHLLEERINQLRPEIRTMAIPEKYKCTEFWDKVHLTRPDDSYVIFTADNAEVNEVIKRTERVGIDSRKVIWAGAEADEITIRFKPVTWHVEGARYEDIWVGTAWGAAMALVQIFSNRAKGLYVNDVEDIDCRFTRVNGLEEKEKVHELKKRIRKTKDFSLGHKRYAQHLEKLIKRNTDKTINDLRYEYVINANKYNTTFIEEILNPEILKNYLMDNEFEGTTLTMPFTESRGDLLFQY